MLNNNLWTRISHLENDLQTEIKKWKNLKMKNSLLTNELNKLKQGLKKYLGTGTNLQALKKAHFLDFL